LEKGLTGSAIPLKAVPGGDGEWYLVAAIRSKTVSTSSYTRKVARRKPTPFPRAIMLNSYASEQNMALRLLSYQTGQ
jgi:hypothetical protein